MKLIVIISINDVQRDIRMQITKPDLLVHPLYESTLLYGDQYGLAKHFNILTVASLTVNTAIQPYYVTDAGVQLLHSIYLAPYFTKNMIRGSGVKPQCTTYELEHEVQIYNIAENGPRYVIWTLNDPVSVCSTCIDRVAPGDLYAAAERARRWSYDIVCSKKIIVFDLDETLIDRNCNILGMADEILSAARRVYDLVVLYSHGSSLHVDENVAKIMHMRNYQHTFDLVLSNNMVDRRCPKNLLQLYNHFPNIRFTFATLVDDSLYNWTPEYTKLIIPNKVSTLKWALNII